MDSSSYSMDKITNRNHFLTIIYLLFMMFIHFLLCSSFDCVLHMFSRGPNNFFVVVQNASCNLAICSKKYFFQGKPEGGREGSRNCLRQQRHLQIFIVEIVCVGLSFLSIFYYVQLSCIFPENYSFLPKKDFTPWPCKSY